MILFQAVPKENSCILLMSCILAQYEQILSFQFSRKNFAPIIIAILNLYHKI